MVSTSRDDTLKIWDGAKGLQQLVSIRHYNNTGVPPLRLHCLPTSLVVAVAKYPGQEAGPSCAA